MTTLSVPSSLVCSSGSGTRLLFCTLCFPWCWMVVLFIIVCTKLSIAAGLSRTSRSAAEDLSISRRFASCPALSALTILSPHRKVVLSSFGTLQVGGLCASSNGVPCQCVVLSFLLRSSLHHRRGCDLSFIKSMKPIV